MGASRVDPNGGVWVVDSKYSAGSFASTRRRSWKTTRTIEAKKGRASSIKVMIAVAGAMMAARLTAEPVKPVNGVGQGPLIGWIDTKLFAYLGEAGVPFARLHVVI